MGFICPSFNCRIIPFNNYYILSYIHKTWGCDRCYFYPASQPTTSLPGFISNKDLTRSRKKFALLSSPLAATTLKNSRSSHLKARVVESVKEADLVAVPIRTSIMSSSLAASLFVLIKAAGEGLICGTNFAWSRPWLAFLEPTSELKSSSGVGAPLDGGRLPLDISTALFIKVSSGIAIPSELCILFRTSFTFANEIAIEICLGVSALARTKHWEGAWSAVLGFCGFASLMLLRSRRAKLAIRSDCFPV